jgi:hypothetical protein
VFAPYSIASAKAMAPEGPAELNNNSFSQCASVLNIAIKINNKNGRPISLIAEIKAIGMLGTKRLWDKIIPNANSITGGAAGPINSSAVLKDSSISKFIILKQQAKKIDSNTGFWIKRLAVVLNENDARVFAIKSVVIMKNAKTTVASQRTTALIGRFPNAAIQQLRDWPDIHQRIDENDTHRNQPGF